MTAVSYRHTVTDPQGLAFAGLGPFARPEWCAQIENTTAARLIALARNGDEAVANDLSKRTSHLILSKLPDEDGTTPRLERGASPPALPPDRLASRQSTQLAGHGEGRSPQACLALACQLVDAKQGAGA